MKSKAIGMLFIALVVIIGIIGVCDAAPEVAWDKTFGGDSTDQAYSVQQTSDGGYILAGYTNSYGAGSNDVWLVKTDPDGNKVWDKTFGGTGGDGAYSVQQTSDGGYILAGHTNSYGAGGSDFWLVKTGSEGNKVWDKTFGGTEDDYAWSVQQTSDGGYILAGSTYSFGVTNGDSWLIKTDSNGNKEWDKTFGGLGSDWTRSVQQTSDSGYILAGFAGSSGANGQWLIKTDSNGHKVWDTTYGEPDMGWAYSVQQTSDGGYILAGYVDFGAGYLDVWLAKTDSNGNKEWDMTFGGTEDDYARSVQQTSDGGYILAGSTYSFGVTNGDSWLIKTDSNGNKEWDKTFGGLGSDWARSVQQTSDGGYILAGYTSGDFSLVKVGGVSTPTPTQTPTPTPTGYICVWSSPSGASIYLDGAYQGVTGSDWFWIYDVSPGYRTIRLEKSGYEDYTTTVYVTAGDTTSKYATLTQETGSIYISSTPSGAFIYLDGVYKGTTSKTISGVSVGSHTVKLTKSGYEDYTTTVYVTAGDTTSKYATLTQETGSIYISSTPSGAFIYLDGVYKGTTSKTISGVSVSKTISGVSVGSHTVKLTKFGYEDYTTIIYVTAGGAASVPGYLIATPAPMPTQTPMPISDIRVPSTSETSRVTIEGAIFPVPDSLEDEIEKYREIAPVKQYASLLATKDTLFVVFSDELVETGFATIDGWKLINLRWDGLELGVVKAESVNIETKGTSATIDEIKSNPDEYVLKLVKIDATVRQISFLVDPDDGSDFVMPVTAGRIVKHPTNPANFVNLPEKAAEFSKNHNRESLKQILGVTDEGLSVFDFETKYWTDAEAEVNAIVLYPEVIEKFIARATETDISNIVIQKGDKVLLYNVDTHIKSVETSIREIKSNPESYIGKVVTFTASDMGATMSVQEAIKEANSNKYPPTDTLLHSMVTWCRPPPALDEIQSGTLVTAGVSSHHQDVVMSSVNGVFEVQSYTGKVVSATELNMNLPDAVALVTYKREKVSDISTEEISSDVKHRIENEVLTMILQESELLMTAVDISQTDVSSEGEEPFATPKLSDMPGFEAVFGIIGLLMVAFLMRRRK